MHMDSKQVFDVITEKIPSEKRLFIDATASRLVYNRFEIDMSGLVKDEDSPSGAFSKVKHNGKLNVPLETGGNETPIQEWTVKIPADGFLQSTESRGSVTITGQIQSSARRGGVLKWTYTCCASALTAIATLADD